MAAKDAYITPAFQAWRRYAEASGSSWFILSAKYGLLKPDDLIDAYNLSVSSALRDAMLQKRLREPGRTFLDRYDRVVLLDWERFKPLVRVAVRADMPCVLHRIRY